MSQQPAQSQHSAVHPHPERGGPVQHPTLERYCDVAVIGGAAAGLAAALQLARQRRSVIVVDDGTPRNAAAAHMHGYLGHEGAAPADLTRIGRAEVRSHGGEVLTGRVTGVHRHDGRFRLDLTGGHTLVARRVLVATGLTDQLPAIDGVAEQWGRGVIHCPFCHGFEVRDQRLVQIVTHPLNLHPTPLFRHLTDRLTVVLHDPTGIDEAVVDALAASGVIVERSQVRRVIHAGPDGAVCGVELGDGRVLEADAVVVGARFRPRADLLAGVGLTISPHPIGAGDTLAVDPRGETTVSGIYAAGNVTDPSLQVLASAAQGSQVGAMIAFSLAEEDLAAAARVSGEEADWEHRYSGDERAWSGNPNGTLVHEVTDLAPGRALDIGAGEGADALWLAGRGWTVTATDISGNALARLHAEAVRRGLAIDLLRGDANDPTPFGTETFDLVSLQYGSFKRTPDQRALRSLLDAVAPSGTLLVVHHDLTAMRQPVDVETQTQMHDPEAFVGVDEVAAALTADPETWHIEVHETRSRPPGAASTHHVADVVLRATRRAV